MSKAVLGIDLGTSSAKVLLVKDGCVLQRAAAPCEKNSPEGWLDALGGALSALEDLKTAGAVGLSSQVGTYLIRGFPGSARSIPAPDGKEKEHIPAADEKKEKELLLPWYTGEGSDELAHLLAEIPEEVFRSEIGMAHPRLLSYPLPRLCFAGKHYTVLGQVRQPKDVLMEWLTGHPVSDPWSWRGLADAEKCCYSRRLLSYARVEENALPPLREPWQKAGCVTKSAAERTGLPAGIPVFTGLNDFYAALLGMGITREGDWFDISGSSEHLGVLEEQVRDETELISSPYLKGTVHYGVTASSGVSLEFGRNTFPRKLGEAEQYLEDAPVFLPYLNGERAPIFDPGAKGAFYGITGKCTGEHMAYAVLEGVAFSLLDISEHLRAGGGTEVRLCGGAAGNRFLTRLKAALLQKDFLRIKEQEASALGAAFTAMLGLGEIRSLEEAAGLVRMEEKTPPDDLLRQKLMPRYALYKKMQRRI